MTMKNFKTIIAMVCLVIMFNSNAIAKAATVIPMPIFMSSDNSNKRTINSVEDGTAILHEDGKVTNVIVNKSLKNPPTAGNMSNGDKRITVVIGVDENENPVTYAEKGSKQETELRQIIKDHESFDKESKKAIDKTLIIVAAVLGLSIIVMVSITL